MFTPNTTPKASKTLGFVNIKIGGKSLPITMAITDQGLFEALQADPQLFARIVGKAEISVKSNERQPVGIDWTSL
jgi:hypothetical protein